MKAEYAKDKGLGGIFSWSGDQDNGLLANAAREGAGYLANEEVIDMGPLYNPGEECALTPVTNLRGRIYDVEVGQLKVDFVFDYHDVGNLSSKAYLRLYYAASPNGECIDSITLNYNKYHARSDLFFLMDCFLIPIILLSWKIISIVVLMSIHSLPVDILEYKLMNFMLNTYYSFI